MLKKSIQLTLDETVDLDLLLKACQEHDGAPVAMQKDKALNRHPEMDSWFLYYIDGMLVGALSIFQILVSEAEISACVHPNHRGTGLYKQLESEAVGTLKAYGVKRILCVVDGKSDTGAALMAGKEYPCVQTEYSMVFPKENLIPPVKAVLHIMKTGMGELDDIAQISAAAFGDSLEISKEIVDNGMKSKERERYSAYLDNQMVGTVSLLIHDGSAMINGFAIAPPMQGKGYGMDFLAQLLRMLRRRCLLPLLDVNSENGPAYRLYKRMGFQETEVQDYYERLI